MKSGGSGRVPAINKNQPTNRQKSLKTVSVSSAKKDVEALASGSHCTCKGPEVDGSSDDLLEGLKQTQWSPRPNSEMRLRR